MIARMTETMSDTTGLARQLTARILRHLDMPANAAPDLGTLQQLVACYTRIVPWESASRIVRRARHDTNEACAILGADFWESHLALGTGGTCYESNYSFFGLLRRLGYAGYLTLNDIGGAVGCHSAMVILLGGQKYLVDVGFPVHAVLPLREDRIGRVSNPILDYTVEPLGDKQLQIRREPHPRSEGFLLHDRPVTDKAYRAVAFHDYRDDGGQFLNEIVIHKVVDGQLWRFNSDERPLRLQQFADRVRQDHLLGGDAAAEVATTFGMAREIVAEAMGVLGL